MSLVVVVHWPVLSAQALTFDDGSFLSNNPLVQNPGWASVKRFFGEVLEPSTVRGYYLPLSMTSLMVDYAAGGRPEYLAPFHRTSLGLHALNTGLVIALLFALFRQVWVAALVGLLYGLHPLTVEPIVWVGERKTLLAAFFSFACMVAYVGHAHRGGRLRLAAAILLYLLALLSKPTAVPLPALLILLDYWPLRRLNRRAWLEKIPFVLIAVVAIVVTVTSHSRTAGVSTPDDSSIVAVPLRIGYLIAFYLGKILWPVPLSTVYTMPDPVSLTNSAILIGCLITVACAVAAVLLRRRWPAFAIGGFCFAIALFPTLGLLRYSWVTASDKYVYLPAFGLLLLVTALIARLWTVPKRTGLARGLILVTVIALALGEAIVTRGQIAHWATSERLGRHVVAVSPTSAAARCNLGIALHMQGRYDEAIEQYTIALEAEPQDALTHNAMGDAMAQTGKPLNALGHFLTARTQRPDYPPVHNNLGNTFVTLNQLDQAIESFDIALQLWPDYADAYVSRGYAYSRMGKPDHAIRDYRRGLALKPDHVLGLNNLGNALLQQGKTTDAIATFERALAIDANRADTLSNLGNAWLTAGEPGKGVECYRRSLSLDPGLVAANYNLGEAYLRLGRPDEAKAQFNRALSLAESMGDAATATMIRKKLDDLAK
jgi:tetratricopeptide (TPR) repeat protein